MDAYTGRENSEKVLSDALISKADAGAAVFHVRTSEVMRCLAALRKLILADKSEYVEWDVAHGFRTFTLQTLEEGDAGDGQVNFPPMYKKVLEDVRAQEQNNEIGSATPRYYVYVEPTMFFNNNPLCAYLTMYYSHMLPKTPHRVILVTGDAPLPSPVNEYVTPLRFDVPTSEELNKAFDYIVDAFENEDGAEEVDIELDHEDREAIINAGMGLTRQNFSTHVAVAMVESFNKNDGKIIGREVRDGVLKGKTEIIGRDGLLDLSLPEDMNNVGGMDNLKTWVRKRRNCYSKEARDYGIEPVKGVVLVGPPGTGKSLVAKAIAGELGVSLIRLDFGKVFNSLVGSSEERIRKALRDVEAVSPCVLFVDEIDKGLGGVSGSSGDSGVGSRVLGTFLTWLQESSSPVFTVVTANNINGLPPELMRRGRFDGIFSTKMPTPEERTEILKIHLRLRGQDPEAFTAQEYRDFQAASLKYVPAEIEAAVKDALIEAYDEGSEFTMTHITDALKAMKPLSVAFKEQIDTMIQWAETNATPVTSEVKSISSATKASTGRKVLARKRSL